MGEVMIRTRQLNENNLRARENPRQFVLDCEQRYTDTIETLADSICGGLRGRAIILLAGPSASGKTTTAGRISGAFQARGIHAPVVSLDNFYYSVSNLPLRDDGKPDYESVYGLDLERANRCFCELLEDGVSEFPIYDFQIQRRAEKCNTIRIGDGDVVIVEGIHALNPVIHAELDSGCFINLYAGVMTRFADGEETLLAPEDIRLVRRMVRDYHYRASSFDNTLDMWEGVMEGEEKYIRPFIPYADHIIDTTHDYEPNIFHHFFYPLLKEAVVSGNMDLRYRETYRRLVKAYEMFDDLEKALLPDGSMLREFVL